MCSPTMCLEGEKARVSVNGRVAGSADATFLAGSPLSKLLILLRVFNLNLVFHMVFDVTGFFEHFETLCCIN